MKKFLGILLLFAISLVIPALASAQSFTITDVDVNGMDVADGDVIYIERGDTVTVRVELQADVNASVGDLEDIRIKVWIAGYEYDDIEDVTEMFDLNPGVKTTKYLELEIPDDIEAGEEYSLKVEAYTQDEEYDWSASNDVTLEIEAQRHDLQIQDVIFSPGLSINANTPLFTTVRIENLGDKKEEDIKVEVSIPALGISAIDYIDELGTIEEDEDDEETSDSTDALYLDLSNAEPGTYTLQVKVEYNNGYSEINEEYDLTITGGVAGGVTTISQDVIDVANKVKALTQGESIVYKIDIANLGSSAKTYSAEILGLDTWATARVDPSFALIQAGNTGELYVYVSAKEDATAGQHLFTVKVKEGSTVVKELNLEANVAAKAKQPSSWSNAIKGLEIGFIVLLIILVILGIIIAITKMKGRSEETFTSGEGQTYY